ncbi:MAG: c-type cytochrome [Pelagimonas sp.]|jgi:cytochrome c|nr:c-type cytochrome [Pelagimonas sp.]
MSKSLNLFAGAALGLGATFVAAYNFADRNVAKMPENPDMMAALPTPVAPTASLAPAGGLIAAANASTPGVGQNFGLGREAMAEEIAAWDVDVQPDGTGLPDGSGNAYDGESIFEDNCAVCHGSFAEGVDNWPKLAGGDGTLADEDPLKTVGSYWPHLSTVWDYVNRSMPFGAAQTLTADEVYAITAYILYSNDLIDDDFELSKDTWNEVVLPNAGGFILDDRAETEYTIWRTEPCMENCKDSVEITMRATVLDVTPDEEGGEMAMAEDHAAAPAAEAAPAETVQVAAAETPAAEETPAAAPAMAALDADLVAKGEKVFKKCKACHQIGDGAKDRTGPQLNGIMGRAIGGVEGFKYSKTMGSMGGTWDEENMAAFLANPKKYVKGTKMSFAGLKKEADLAAVTEYLKSYSQ